MNDEYIHIFTHIISHSLPAHAAISLLPLTPTLQEWNDVNLRWNESDYGQVKDLRIPPYKIWKPDVLMYNR